MSSLVEILITAIGTEQAASAIGKVNEGLRNTVSELGHAATAALSFNAAFQGIEGAIGDGAMFSQLAMRIGETVRETVVLDQAFKNSGLGSGSIAEYANRLQRALGGVNDMGMRTDTAFHRLGTSIEALKPLTFAEQLQVLSDGFGKLANQNDRANVAMQLFGRGGGQMLQLLGNPEALKIAADQADELAKRTERDAKAFHELEVAYNGVTAKIKEMWMAAAEQLLPALQAIASVLGHINLAPLGAALGVGGATALAAGISTAFVTKLDSMLYQWAVNADKLGQDFSGKFLLPLTGGLAKLFQNALPPVIIAAVGAAIVTGIAQAIADYQSKLRGIAGGSKFRRTP